MASRNTSRRLVGLLASLVAAPFMLAAQAPAAGAPLRLSFADAVRVASSDAPAVALAGLRADEADARVRQVRAALLPSLSLGGSWLNRYDSLRLFTPPWAVRLPGRGLSSVAAGRAERSQVGAIGGRQRSRDEHAVARVDRVHRHGRVGVEVTRLAAGDRHDRGADVLHAHRVDAIAVEEIPIVVDQPLKPQHIASRRRVDRRFAGSHENLGSIRSAVEGCRPSVGQTPTIAPDLCRTSADIQSGAQHGH